MLLFHLVRFRSSRNTSPTLEKGRRKFGGFFRILGVSQLRLWAPAIVQTGLYRQKLRKTLKKCGYAVVCRMVYFFCAAWLSGRHVNVVRSVS